MHDQDLLHATIGIKIRVPRAFSSEFDIITVTAFTASTVVCGKTRIRKSDGLVIGSGSGWHRAHAQVATPEDIFKYRVAIAQTRVREIKVTVGNLQAVEALLADNK